MGARRLVLVLAAIALLASAVAPSYSAGAIRYADNGGVKQIFIPADAYTSRSYNSEDLAGNVLGGPDFVPDPAAAPNTLSGSAYNFRGAGSPGSGIYGPTVYKDWWVEYTIPVDALPAGFLTPGSTWGFLGRVSHSAPALNTVSIDSDWLCVVGDPVDNVDPNNWQVPQNPGPLLNGQPAQRVFNNLSISTDASLFNYTFGWFSEGYGTGPVLMTRVMNPVNGKIVFRLYEREADPYNALVDVLCFTNTTSITGVLPTDADFLAATAVPEPSSFAVLALGGLQALVFVRRRRR